MEKKLTFIQKVRNCLTINGIYFVIGLSLFIVNLTYVLTHNSYEYNSIISMILSLIIVILSLITIINCFQKLRLNKIIETTMIFEKL